MATQMISLKIVYRRRKKKTIFQRVCDVLTPSPRALDRTNSGEGAGRNRTKITNFEKNIIWIIKILF